MPEAEDTGHILCQPGRGDTLRGNQQAFGGSQTTIGPPPRIIGDLAKPILQRFACRCAICGCVLCRIKKPLTSREYEQESTASPKGDPLVTPDFTPEQKSTLGMCWSTINELLKFCERIQSKLNEDDAFLARMYADQLKIIRRRLLSSFPELSVWLN